MCAREGLELGSTLYKANFAMADAKELESNYDKLAQEARMMAVCDDTAR